MTMTALPITRFKYEFDDITVVVLVDNSTADVFVEVNSNLMYVFGIKAPTFKDIDIVTLHENGYFDNFITEEV